MEIEVLDGSLARYFVCVSFWFLALEMILSNDVGFFQLKFLSKGTSLSFPRTLKNKGLS